GTGRGMGDPAGWGGGRRLPACGPAKPQAGSLRLRRPLLGAMVRRALPRQKVKLGNTYGRLLTRRSPPTWVIAAGLENQGKTPMFALRRIVFALVCARKSSGVNLPARPAPDRLSRRK